MGVKHLCEHVLYSPALVAFAVCRIAADAVNIMPETSTFSSNACIAAMLLLVWLHAVWGSMHRQVMLL